MYESQSLYFVDWAITEKCNLSCRHCRGMLEGGLSGIPEIAETLAGKLSQFGAVRKVKGQASIAKEAAEGAYIIGEGLLGGKYKGIVDCLELRKASGTMFDYVLVKGAELEKP